MSHIGCENNWGGVYRLNRFSQSPNILVFWAKLSCFICIIFPIIHNLWCNLKKNTAFSWSGTHNVAQVTKDGYDNCNATGNLLIGQVQTVSPYNFLINSTDPYYFICTVPEHCTNGQKVTVQVRSWSAAAPSASFSSVFFAIAASTFIFASLFY